MYACTYTIPHKTCAGSCDFCSCYIINSYNWTSTSAVNLNDMSKICITTTIHNFRCCQISMISCLPTRLSWQSLHPSHYSHVRLSAVASQISSLMIVCWTIYSDAEQRKHQSSVSLAFVRGIHRSPVNSPHKWPVTRKMFPFDDIIMVLSKLSPKWRPPHYTTLIRRGMNFWVGVIHKRPCHYILQSPSHGIIVTHDPTKLAIVSLNATPTLHSPKCHSKNK